MRRLSDRAAKGDAKAKDRLASVQPFVDELKDANQRMLDFKRASKKDDNPTGESSDSSSEPKPAVDSKKPPEISKVQGAPAGSTIGSFTQGKGWEVKDKSGKVIGHVR